MNLRISIALIVFLIVIALGVFLIVAPSPEENEALPPFTSEMVKVSSPLPGATVSKTFTATGFARGMWFFEASFPVEIRDPQNNLVGQGIAQANGDWMTEEFVPFTAPITVNAYTGPATLVLKKDNPSGLPENDASESFDIVIQ